MPNDVTLTRVTAHLLNGLVHVPGETISLDGPLLYAAVLERIGEAMFGDPPSNDQLARETAEPDPAVPLAVHRAGGTWCYCVSAGDPVGHHGTSLTHWNKRIDDGLLVPAVQDGAVDMGRQGKVQINSAQYKSYHMPVWTEHVEAIEWYALTEDPQRLAYLLGAHVHHIGRDRGIGSGVVTSWEVETTDEPSNRWLRRPDGSLARPVPVSMLDSYDGPTMVAPYRPPYWLVQHQSLCAVPSDYS